MRQVPAEGQPLWMKGKDVHQTILTATDSQGRELWSCTQCERRMIVLSWQPWKRLILDPGDEYIPHAGGKGGLQMGDVNVSVPPSQKDLAWLASHGIEWDAG